MCICANRDESAWAGSLDADDPPAVIHLAEGELPVKMARLDQVVGQRPHALRLTKIGAVNTLAHGQAMQGRRMLTGLQPVQLNLFDDHVRFLC